MLLGEGYRGRDVNVGDAVSVGHAEWLVRVQMLPNASQTTSCSGRIPRVGKRHMPWLSYGVMHDHLVLCHVEGDVGGMQEIVRKILLDDVALVSAADDEVIDAVV